MARVALGAMEKDTQSSLDRIAARVVELETRLMHMERMLGDLDQVLLAQQKQISALEHKATAVEAQLDAMVNAPDQRKPEDEKPPHY
jgi:uncharacterized coiled-coil protein SlyX